MLTARHLKAVVGATLAALLVACGVSSPTGGSGGSGNGSSSGGIGIRVMSNRADLISGGDALLDVVLPAGVDTSTVTMSLNGNDVSSLFAPSSDGTLRGLVTGLNVGDNSFKAQYPGGKAQTTLVDHPNGGPILAGPQLQPWTCQDGAVDAQCNQPASYSFVYLSSDPLKIGFQPYDPENPPSDVANTTTDQGVTVPFIVRVETGYQDRDQYQIAALYQPGQDWTAISPQAQFNHKLLITHGVSCGVSYMTGTAPSVLSYAPANIISITGGNSPNLPSQAVPDSAQYALGAGFAVMSTALDYSGHNCNVALQAESLIMAKEHLIEHYGTLRYTIGTGCSGGSLAQQWIANAYPGIYQGILPTCSFPDAWSTATQFADYHLLLAYFGDNSKWADGVSWPMSKQAKVMGRELLTLNATVSESAQFHVAVPTDPCSGVSDAQRYDPVNNPGGTRCTITDAAINLFGPRPPELWSDMEKAAGHGFAGFPVDNVGVQYGLSALQDGSITPLQFLDVNEKIGGLDVDTNLTSTRLAAVEPALGNAYRSGMINEGNNMDQVAIIDCRGPDPGLFHDAYRAFAMRGRLDREHGSHANQLIWEGALIIAGDLACNQNSLIAMDAWLSAVEKDLSDVPLAQKIVADKPGDLTDECWDGAGQKLSNQLCSSLVVPIFGTPRTVAGDAITTDTNKCQLRPLNRNDDYGPTAFTDDQWAQMEALFPNGVCDFSKPGVSQQGTIPWLTYQNSSGNVIYGGTPLAAAASNDGIGWTSPAFRGFSW
ncbi:DUF6351 family protein [Solimonas terrae]|uniref:DUF6351 domain-containing protein n=1 Tax=Solimonas terrae TaxID=1396819 RepID=A0A6M2BT69_9GAMM|nr:DUF6351 family protein [Solimonas terrae]NGY05852.1 hypothetical protein [Solimonas terrae]